MRCLCQCIATDTHFPSTLTCYNNLKSYRNSPLFLTRKSQHLWTQNHMQCRKAIFLMISAASTPFELLQWRLGRYLKRTDDLQTKRTVQIANSLWLSVLKLNSTNFVEILSDKYMGQNRLQIFSNCIMTMASTIGKRRGVRSSLVGRSNFVLRTFKIQISPPLETTRTWNLKHLRCLEPSDVHNKLEQS